MAVGQGVYIYSEYWLATWANTPGPRQHDIRFLWVYAVLVGSVVIISVARALIYFASLLRWVLHVLS